MAILKTKKFIKFWKDFSIFFKELKSTNVLPFPSNKKHWKKYYFVLDGIRYAAYPVTEVQYKFLYQSIPKSPYFVFLRKSYFSELKNFLGCKMTPCASGRKTNPRPRSFPEILTNLKKRRHKLTQQKFI